MTNQQVVRFDDITVPDTTQLLNSLRGQVIVSAEPEYSDSGIIWTQQRIVEAVRLLEQALKIANGESLE